ncbi:hypothetical protein ACFTZK_00270 [Streptomyces decoyicus]|uniref:hypothetical protein n=1 Tax=Streptomyces decoyicus TaxID=249567 RepID=UPI0036337D0E
MTLELPTGTQVKQAMNEVLARLPAPDARPPSPPSNDGSVCGTRPSTATTSH